MASMKDASAASFVEGYKKDTRKGVTQVVTTLKMAELPVGKETKVIRIQLEHGDYF
jgi:hypothetical protein